MILKKNDFLLKKHYLCINYLLFKMLVMKNLVCLFLMCCICMFFSCGSQPQSQPQPQPVSVIFDTDMAPDYDDVGALAMLHAFADNGEAKILATLSSNMYVHAVPCIEIINIYFGRPNIPIGAPRKGPDIVDPRFKEEHEHWPDVLPTRYEHTIKSSAEAPDAVQVYRKILANEPDNSVNIITVGFLTNVAALLQSPPDQYSKLNGKELVKKKVKRLISMAGNFEHGWEFNVVTDSTASVIVFNEWPTPVLICGFEIGVDILTGLRLIASDIQNSPVKDAFEMGMVLDPQGRNSWDQTAVLAGVRGTEKYFGLLKGRMIVNPNGSNTWEDDPNGPHDRITWKMPKEELTILIEELMMHVPQ